MRFHRATGRLEPLRNLESPAWVAELLEIPEATLAVWRARGLGPKFYKVGRHVRYDPDEVGLWLQDQARLPRDDRTASRA